MYRDRLDDSRSGGPGLIAASTLPVENFRVVKPLLPRVDGNLDDGSTSCACGALAQSPGCAPTDGQGKLEPMAGADPVSYTHLTLPTNREV